MSESELNKHTVQGINGFWIQARAEWESEREALQNENARLRAAIEAMVTHLHGDNFRSQHMAAARSIGEKVLSGRYQV